jgi:hypothetical protein
MQADERRNAWSEGTGCTGTFFWRVDSAGSGWRVVVPVAPAGACEPDVAGAQERCTGAQEHSTGAWGRDRRPGGQEHGSTGAWVLGCLGAWVLGGVAKGQEARSTGARVLGCFGGVVGQRVCAVCAMAGAAAGPGKRARRGCLEAGPGGELEGQVAGCGRCARHAARGTHVQRPGVGRACVRRACSVQWRWRCWGGGPGWRAGGPGHPRAKARFSSETWANT